jgi:hypothetical protein
MILVNGIVLGGSIHKSRTGKDNLRFRADLSASFEDDQVASAVDVQIEERVAIAVNVAHLRGEIEENIDIPDSFSHQGSVADISFDEFDFSHPRFQVK